MHTRFAIHAPSSQSCVDSIASAKPNNGQSYGAPFYPFDPLTNVLVYRRLPILVHAVSRNQTATLNFLQSLFLWNNFGQDVPDENSREQRKPDICSAVFNHG